MTRVLFLAYHFPPIGGAGVQRSIKFVRYLPEFGFEPVVVTGPGSEAGRWTPVDESLAPEIPSGARVLRLPTEPPASSGAWRGRAERWLGVKEPFFGWWEDGAVSTAGGVQDVDVIYASMSPFESGAAAARLGERLGKPWVADLRDPWALDEMQVYATRLHRRLALRRMRALLSTADAIIMNTEEAARRVRAFPELAGKRIVAVPNGFDPGDFAGSEPHRNDGAFRIVHTGYLHTELGRRHAVAGLGQRLLGGGVPGVNILTRSHVYLLEAIDRVVAGNPALASRIELHLAGVLSNSDVDAAGGSRVVRAYDYVPHGETVELLRSADLLFLPMHDLPAGRNATIVPGKTYEYLASGRPILAAVPDGDARNLLTRAGTAFLCRPDDVSCMAEVIAGQVERVRTGGPAPLLRHDVLAPYERRNLTEKLARVFDAVVDGRAGATRDRALKAHVAG